MKLTDFAIAVQSLDAAPASAKRHIEAYLNGSAVDVTIEAPKRVEEAVRVVMRKHRQQEAARIRALEERAKAAEKAAEEALRRAADEEKARQQAEEKASRLESRVEELDQALKNGPRVGILSRR